VDFLYLFLDNNEPFFVRQLLGTYPIIEPKKSQPFRIPCLFILNNHHGPAAQNKGRPHHQRIPDPAGNGQSCLFS
jgi:hypothetical protein